MDKDQSRTAFTMKDLNKMDAATKDNAQPQPKPPMQIQHPRLAPPGSAGIRLDRMPPPAQDNRAPAKRPSLDRELGKPSEVHREFKPLAQKSPDMDRSRNR
ncbi:MAG: hypothetical protein K2X00_17530 [Nitrospiraceae bacterium]|nr:hypothetical protein [Nitrospiraceae bacterium]OQW74167.1 MAG: hypothetical protein BVN33_09155 [Proteobacteria bacterium ST_bin13]